MRIRSHLLVSLFLWSLGFFIMSGVQASQVPFYVIEQEWRASGGTLGSLIDSNPTYKDSILKNCLVTTVGKLKNGVISATTPQEITRFFTGQELVKHVTAPVKVEDGKIKTYAHTYGVEFPHHGPVEEKAIALIKTLSENEDVTFLDIGAGYGAFGNRVLAECHECEGLTVCLNECLSVQCYQLAQQFEQRKNVLIYPCDILGRLNYYPLDRRVDLSTIFNVHHFMHPQDVKDAIRKVYGITEKGGYHIAIALSPYHRGDSSVLAQEHDKRVTSNKANPGYFTENDVIQLLVNSIYGGLMDMRAPAFFPSKEVYEAMFRDAGFRVEEAGYFSTHPEKPREFSYIIAHK